MPLSAGPGVININMLRFNFGTKLAGECRRLGCPGDLGYQTFLYPSDKEIR